jgi:hypothetical protein
VIHWLSVLHDRNRIVKHPRGSKDPATEADWLEIAIEEHGKFGFQGIVHSGEWVARASTASAPVLKLANALDSPRWLELTETQTPAVPTTDAGFRRMIAPVVRHAKKLVLIDRYLTPHEGRFFQTVKIRMELLRHDPRGFRRIPIHIHAGDPGNAEKDRNPEPVDQRLAKWQSALQDFITESWPYRSEVSLWQDRTDRREWSTPGQKFHDRYFLTDQCAVAAQSGLDCSWDENNFTTWSLLDDRERLRISDLVNTATSPWERVGHMSLPKAD